jgi:hypothetical protein
MKQTNLSLPEIGLIAATRGMGGFGAGLLLSSKFGDKKRKAIGWPLFAVGALSTIPLIMDVAKKMHNA